MRRFYLNRERDHSGVSGTGRVAEGVQFKNGWCVMCWLSEFWSLAMYPNMALLLRIHGHDGATALHWIDEEGTPSREYLDDKPEGG